MDTLSHLLSKSQSTSPYSCSSGNFCHPRCTVGSCTFGSRWPTSHFHYFLLSAFCIDCSTRWSKAMLLPDITADTVACAFLSRLISLFSVPSTIINNCSAQFEASLFTLPSNLLGPKRVHTMAYHPCANSLVEHFHWSSKAAIHAQLNPSNWKEFLLLIMPTLCTTVKEDLTSSHAQLVFGTTHCLPAQFASPSTQVSDLHPSLYADCLTFAIKNLHPTTPHAQNPAHHVPSHLQHCTHDFSALMLFTCLSNCLMKDPSKYCNGYPSIYH